MRRSFLPACALVLFALSGLSAAAESRMRAVLVGVGDYLTLDADLQGPPNDVALMARMLLRRGVAAEDIRALTDTGADLPEGIVAVAPDRAAVLSAFSAAIEASARGDTLLFYFSGHGTQAPDTNGDEQGGQDALFLPRDAGAWNGTTKEVENAIRDDELAELARRAGEGGVRLVGIIDACHSATGFRALDDGPGRARYVDPGSLGIPASEAQPADAAVPPVGDYVFLYAAQSDQRAFEYPLDGAAWYGDFTRNLVNVLQDVPDLTYEQLLEAVTLRLRTRSGQTAQTPDIEGPMAGSAVFGGDAPSLRRIRVDGTVLRAGILQDVTVGSEVTLYAGPAAAQPAGRAVVTRLRAAEADLELLDPAPSVRVTHAEIVRRAVDVSFTAALEPGAAERLDALVPGGAELLARSLDFPLSDSGDNTIVWAGDAFALVGRDGILDAHGAGSSPRLLRPEQSTDPVADLAIALTKHARRARLEQALAQLSGQAQTGFSLLNSAPEVDVRRLEGTWRGGRCRLTGTAMELRNPAAARHCDGLELAVINATTKMQDVTVLYVDSEAGISLLWPRQSLSNRIPSGETRTIRLGLRNSSQDHLRETLLVLSVPAEPGAPRTVLDGLAGGTMRGDGGPMAAYLAGLADPHSASRGFSLTPPGTVLNMHRLDLTLSPLELKP